MVNWKTCFGAGVMVVLVLLVVALAPCDEREPVVIPHEEAPEQIERSTDRPRRPDPPRDEDAPVVEKRDGPSYTTAVDVDGELLVGFGENPKAGEYRGGPSYHVMAGASSTQKWTFTPNPLGQFTIPTEARDVRARLVAFRSDARDRLLEADGPVRLGDLVGATVTFREAAPVRLTVELVNDLGEPTDGRVRVERDLFDSGVTVFEGEVGSSGSLTVPLLGAGAFRVRLMGAEDRAEMPRDFPTRDAVVEPEGAASVRFEIPRSARLTVRPVREDGVAPERTQAVLLVRERNAWRLLPNVGKAADDGSLLFERLGPGAYIVRAITAGHLPGTAQIELQAAGSRDVVIRLASGGHRISGRLRLPAEFADRRASGFLIRRGETALTQYALWTMTWSEGAAFEATAIPPGEYELVLLGQLNGYGLRFAVSDADVDLGEVDLSAAMSAGPHAVSVRFEHPALSNRTGGVVMIRDESWDARVWRRKSITANGQPVKIEDLQLGTHRIELSVANLDPGRFDIGATREIVSIVGDTPPDVRLELREK